MTARWFSDLVRRLMPLQRECEWLEFKRNNPDPGDIGRNISAIANSAALSGEQFGFVLWGVIDETRQIVGTSFDPWSTKGKGNEDLIPWLTRHVRPQIAFEFHEGSIDDRRCVLLRIPAATRQPVAFDNQEYIRVGSHTRALRDCPEHERRLWRLDADSPFETRPAKENIDADTAIELLEYPALFTLLRKPLPDNKSGIIDAMLSEGLLVQTVARGLCVTNLGAVLFARSLDDFPGIARKACRLVFYRGKTKLEAIREHLESGGYACSFQRLVALVIQSLPRNELIRQALRVEQPMYPDLAIRELVANALIHQDFSITGAGPMVEVFADRIEITNPGSSLVDPLRLLGSPPRSRNEALAGFMRRISICEERGSGVQKIVSEAELFQLPAPRFETHQDFFRATMYAHRKFADLDTDDRVRACYLHACLCHLAGSPMTNASLRKRLAVDKRNYSMVSRVIADTKAQNLIKVRNPHADSRTQRKYIPFWA